EERFWESQRGLYFGGSFDGHAGLADDASNGGVSYSKGAWVLRMLEDEIGRTAFDQGLRAFMAITPGASAGYAEFVTCMSSGAGRDLRAFLDPWVLGTSVPELEASLAGGRVVLRQVQESPLFRLRVGLRFTSGSESEDIAAALDAREALLELPPPFAG